MNHNNENSNFSDQNPAPGKNPRWGMYLLAAVSEAALCVGVLMYIGWFDNNSHTDSRNGDNVLQSYETETPQPDAPGINDWENPDGNNIREIIVDHAGGTDTVPTPQ